MGGGQEDLSEDVVVGGEAPSNGILSYWIDACEDGAVCDFDFADAGSSVVPEIVTNFSDQSSDDGNFFKEFDQILETFNEALLHRPTVDVVSSPQGTVTGDGLLGPLPTDLRPKCTTMNGRSVVSDRKMILDCLTKSKRGYGEDFGGKDDDNGDVERLSKRLRCNSREDESNDRHRREMEGGMKRERKDREWRDRKHHTDRDQRYIRDRERRNSRERNVNEREGSGFWERDSSGKLIFHVGSWENKEEKKPKQEGREREKRDENLRDERGRPVQELARKYQLDVLEQAKKKNTIAFLETGAGKTLIAVLLMKSIKDEMERNKAKMLAIFLVPKVPLVYQVASISSVLLYC